MVYFHDVQIFIRKHDHVIGIARQVLEMFGESLLLDFLHALAQREIARLLTPAESDKQAGEHDRHERDRGGNHLHVTHGRENLIAINLRNQVPGCAADRPYYREYRHATVVVAFERAGHATHCLDGGEMQRRERHAQRERAVRAMSQLVQKQHRVSFAAHEHRLTAAGWQR
jgi:hypothetical protein